MTFKINHLYKVNKVKYQSWFTGRKLVEGGTYLLEDKYSRKGVEGVRTIGVFREVLSNGKLGAPDEADIDWWYTHVSYKDCEDLGEYSPTHNNGVTTDNWSRTVGKLLPQEAIDHFEKEYAIKPADFIWMVQDLSGNGKDTKSVDLMTKCLDIINEYEIEEFLK